MNMDARVAGMCKFNALSVAELVWTLYPRMFALHNLKAEEGSIKQDGSVQLPPMIRTSYERLQANGAYLVGKYKEKTCNKYVVHYLIRYWFRFVFMAWQ